MGGSFHFEIYRGSAHRYAAASDEGIWSAIDACGSQSSCTERSRVGMASSSGYGRMVSCNAAILGHC
jgi:hypothetical protein